MATRNPRRPLPEVRNQLRPSTDWLGYICDMAKCPYNPNHVMKSHRLMRHVSKCEQRHLKNNEETDKNDAVVTEEFEKCPYNSLHRYSPEKQADHFKECKDRAMEIIARIKAGENVDDIDKHYASKKSKNALNDPNPKSDEDFQGSVDLQQGSEESIAKC